MGGKFGSLGNDCRELCRGCVRHECTFDGDTGSGDSVYTDEALEENRKQMQKASFWVNGDRLKIDVNTDLIERTMFNLLADPE
jgi:hypothetical protein